MKYAIILASSLALFACHGEDAKPADDMKSAAPHEDGQTQATEPDAESMDSAEVDAGEVEPPPPLPPEGLVFSSGDARLPICFLLDPASTSTVAILDLVTTVPLSGFSIGLDLPLDLTKIDFDLARDFTAGTVINTGANPRAQAIALPQTGPRKDTLMIVLSQKASGAGSRPNDAVLPAGASFFQLRLRKHPGAATGLVFDGANAAIDGGLLDKGGATVVGRDRIAIGKLELF